MTTSSKRSSAISREEPARKRCLLEAAVDGGVGEGHRQAFGFADHAVYDLLDGASVGGCEMLGVRVNVGDLSLSGLVALGEGLQQADGLIELDREAGDLPRECEQTSQMLAQEVDDVGKGADLLGDGSGLGRGGKGERAAGEEAGLDGAPQDLEAIAAVAQDLLTQLGADAAGAGAEAKESAGQVFEGQAKHVVLFAIGTGHEDGANLGGEDFIALGALVLGGPVEAEIFGEDAERDVGYVFDEGDGNGVAVEGDDALGAEDEGGWHWGLRNYGCRRCQAWSAPPSELLL